MLILTRRPGESVKIGDDITVTVLGVRGNQLRLGFSAPRHVAVHRKEVYVRIQSAYRSVAAAKRGFLRGGTSLLISSGFASCERTGARLAALILRLRGRRQVQRALWG